MTPQQALMILQQAAELAALPKAGHIEVERAVQVLAAVITSRGIDVGGEEHATG